MFLQAGVALNKLPQSYVIQPLELVDLDAVMEIERLSFKSPWSRQVFAEELSRSWAHVDVVRRMDDGAIVAFCNYWLVADEVHLLNVATHPQERRGGHASRLLAHVLEHARRAPRRLVTPGGRPSNQAGQQLYPRVFFLGGGGSRHHYIEEH